MEPTPQQKAVVIPLPVTTPAGGETELTDTAPQQKAVVLPLPVAHRDLGSRDLGSRDTSKLQSPASGALTPYEPELCVLRVRQLSKRFGVVQALDNATFNLGAGEIVGLLGQNGSGKTTLLSALMGRVRPDSGSIVPRSVASALPTYENSLDHTPSIPPRVAPSMGWVPQQLAIYPFLSARANLLTFGRYQGIASIGLPDRIEQALHWAGLEDRADDAASTFSYGMMRRLNVCIGVLDRPQIVLMDEPTLGVDVQSRERMHQMVRELSAAGTAVLYTSHYIEEVERLCDRILIIDRGRIISEGTSRELIDRVVGTTREVEIHSLSLSVEQQRLLRARDLSLDGDRIVARIEDIGRQLPPLLEQLRRDGVPIHNLVIRQPTLAGVFLKLTGRSLAQ